LHYRNLIGYEGLPLGSGSAHRLRIKSLFESWEKIRYFLEVCTEFQVRKIWLQILSFTELLAFIKCTENILGPHQWSYSIGSAVKYIPTYTVYCWDIEYQKIEDMIKHVSLFGIAPDLFGVSGISLTINLRFKFLDKNKCELPYQDNKYYLNFNENGFELGSSTICTSLSVGKNSASVYFNFPFEAVSSEFLDYKNYIQSYLPFTLSPNHWKLWKPNKKLTSYYGRKIKAQCMK
jgi:hypothetical protein